MARNISHKGLHVSSFIRANRDGGGLVPVIKRLARYRAGCRWKASAPSSCQINRLSCQVDGDRIRQKPLRKGSQQSAGIGNIGKNARLREIGRFLPVHAHAHARWVRTSRKGYRSHAQRCADTSRQTEGSKLQAFRYSPAVPTGENGRFEALPSQLRNWWRHHLASNRPG